MTDKTIKLSEAASKYIDAMIEKMYTPATREMMVNGIIQQLIDKGEFHGKS